MSPLASYRLGQGAQSDVLLHGLLGSGRNLRALARQLCARAPGRTVLVPDLTGHGESPPLPARADLQVLAADLIATLESARLPPPWSLIGHSLGGRVALATAELAPGRIRHVVLLDIAPGRIDPTEWEVMEALVNAPADAPSRADLKQHLLAAGLAAATVDWLLMNTRLDEGRCRWTFDRAALARLAETTCAQDLWPVVQSRRVPIGCIRGSRSWCVADEDARRLSAAGCPVLTLDGGHDLHVDAPDALLAALTGDFPTRPEDNR